MNYFKSKQFWVSAPPKAKFGLPPVLVKNGYNAITMCGTAVFKERELPKTVREFPENRYQFSENWKQFFNNWKQLFQNW